jgi:hypothetical protein
VRRNASPVSGGWAPRARSLTSGERLQNKCLQLRDGTLLCPSSDEKSGRGLDSALGKVWTCAVDETRDGGVTWSHHGPIAMNGAGIIQVRCIAGWRARRVTLRARWVTLRARWVTLRARWVTLRARWVTLRARWVTLRALAG